MLEVFLHCDSRALKQILDLFNVRLQVSQLIIVGLVLLLHLRNFALQLLLLRGAQNFPVLVDHPAHGVLFSELLNLICAVFY